MGGITAGEDCGAARAGVRGAVRIALATTVAPAHGPVPRAVGSYA